MSGRAAILEKIKTRLDRSDDLVRKNPARARIEAHAKNLIPNRGQVEDHVVDLFVAEAERATASVARLTRFDDVPMAVSSYLRDHQLPARLKVAPHPKLRHLEWSGTTSLMVRDGAATGDDPVSVSIAIGGVAETGTLVLTSGPETPTSLNFLPLDHIVVVSSGDIAGDYEALWDRIRAQAASRGEAGKLPRTVNWITGPSRTADIEQTILLGAHGPQRLHILIVDEPIED